MKTILAFLIGRHSVDDVISVFDSMIEALEDVIVKHKTAAVDKDDQIKTLQAEVDDHVEEVNRAEEVKKNLQQLLGK